MGDRDKFQALDKEWSALVDTFLETDDGRAVLRDLAPYEAGIFVATLKAHADVLAPTNREVGDHFAKLKAAVHAQSLQALEDIYWAKGKAEYEAKRRANDLRSMARGMAKQVILAKCHGQALQPIPSEPGQADKDGLPTPVVEAAMPTTPVGYDSEELKRLQRPDLPTLLQAFCQGREPSQSDPPPVHVSRYPASPPPAPKEGEQLGQEPSVPPPVPQLDVTEGLESFAPPSAEGIQEDQGGAFNSWPPLDTYIPPASASEDSEDRVSSAPGLISGAVILDDSPEIETGEVTDDALLEEMDEAELEAAFAELRNRNSDIAPKP